MKGMSRSCATPYDSLKSTVFFQPWKKHDGQRERNKLVDVAAVAERWNLTVEDVGEYCFMPAYVAVFGPNEANRSSNNKTSFECSFSKRSWNMFRRANKHI